MLRISAHHTVLPEVGVLVLEVLILSAPSQLLLQQNFYPHVLGLFEAWHRKDTFYADLNWPLIILLLTSPRVALQLNRVTL